MTTAQKLSIRLSEIRQRLNEISGLADDAMTDEIRAEADKLTAEFQNAETQHPARPSSPKARNNGRPKANTATATASRPKSGH